MNPAREQYTEMGADTIPTDAAEKPKPRFFTAVLPSVWFIKLRSKRRRSKTSDTNEPAIPDNAPFLPKTIQNCYKNAELAVFEGAHQPVTPNRKSVEGVTPSRRSIESATTPSRKSATTTTRSTPLTSVATTTSSTSPSVFSRCMYRSTFISGLRSLCKLVDEDSLSTKGRKIAAPTMRAWFLVGCGGTPRPRPRTRQGSLDVEKEPGLMEMELHPIDEATRSVEASRHTKAQSWSGTNAAPWNDEVVKNQVVVKKKNKKYAGSKPTLEHLFSARSDTDSPRKIFQETEEESEIHIEDPKLVSLPWRSMSFGSDSTFRVPSVDDGDDEGNVSDSPSLQLQQRDEDAVMLLASLDLALDKRNLKRLVEDDDENDSDHPGGYSSPRFELHNSPVFESFLESSAKAWGIDFPSLKIDDAKNSGSISDQSRELHCITVQEKTPRRRATPPPPRKAKRAAEAVKRPSPPARQIRDQRIIHPQREESMVDPELHDEFNHARKKFNEDRKRSTKHRRSKQVASVPSPPEKKKLQPPHPPPVKERVAVVVESSYDPYNDFRESMIEMIVDQDIQETGDLEELLQCYLSLNEAEYHNVIVDVFTDVWHELFENKF